MCPIETVIEQVELMDGYLRGLLEEFVEEFEVEYKKASLTQSMFGRSSEGSGVSST